MPAIQVLEHEHKLILRMVNVLTAMHTRLESGGDIEAATLTEVVDFFRTFADKAHHAKEETVLFPTLERYGVSSQGCPIGTLTTEHKQGKALMAALDDAIEKYVRGDSTAKLAISATINAAIELYTDHTWREDYLLFPMTEKVTPKAELEDITKAFDEVEMKFGPDFSKRYEQIVERLEKSYAINNKGGT